MAKTVRVTLELPPQFLRDLHVHQSLAHNIDTDQRLTAGQLVAKLVYMEARGATEEQIHAETPLEWRQGESLVVIHEERRVYEGGAQISGPELRSVDPKGFSDAMSVGEALDSLVHYAHCDSESLTFDELEPLRQCILAAITRVTRPLRSVQATVGDTADVPPGRIVEEQ